MAHADLVVRGLQKFLVPMSAHPELRMSTETTLFDHLDEWDAVLDTVELADRPRDLKGLALDGFVDE